MKRDIFLTVSVAGILTAALFMGRGHTTTAATTTRAADPARDVSPSKGDGALPAATAGAPSAGAPERTTGTR